MQNQTLWNIEKFDEVTSTNDVAIQKSVNNSDSCVIVAKTQTSGRGRRGNKWISQTGNLFFSQVFTSKIAVSYLAFVTSLSISETIKNFFPSADVAIKWPNDVLIDEKKVSGILIEVTENEAVVIGIGVNVVNNPDQDQTSYSTTNLLTMGAINNDKFLKQYLINFDKNYAICQNSFAQIREKWLKYAARLNQKIKIKYNNKYDEGIFKGIDEDGLLLLEQGNKQIKISVAEVFF